MSNILPKKYWHVGRPENLKRVAEDEERDTISKERHEALLEDRYRRQKLELLRGQDSNESKHFDLFESGNRARGPSKTEILALERKQAIESSSLRFSSFNSTWYESQPLNATKELSAREKKKKRVEDPAALFMKPLYFKD
jgi:hypothetical protein